MNLKSIMDYGLISIIILTFILLIAFATPINKETYWELGMLVLVNVVVALIGLLRIYIVRAADPDFKTKIGKAGAEHAWLIFSVTTAVLALVFGRTFQVDLTAMVIQYVLLTVISLISVFMIVEVARQKIAFLD
ncbi:MAG: hypothetical protein M0Z77_07015 [Thermoplasmatales archaeon]|jgi:hypothetical protein|nr:hypothetical protein [Candidatus Thermoplasmatota archaeon]MDA8055383.1 hypothetical protein [Thermoplasmatales archaeon]